MTESANTLKKVAHVGRKYTEAWRQGPAGQSRSGQASLARWRDLDARASAAAEASASKAVRVALMGRVKAGKSTLLNGLVGQPVAGKHAFEMTAAIHEVRVRVGPDGPIAFINRTGQPDESMSPAELAALIEKHRGSSEFWAPVTRLETHVDAPDLPAGIVLFDTPGIGTLTKKNAELTNAFVEAAHVIVWVQSATSLGNAEDYRFLDELSRRGMPVIMVITRADTLEGDERAKVERSFRHRFPDASPIFTSAPNWSNVAEPDQRRALLNALSAFADIDRNAPGAGILKVDIVDAAEGEQAGIARLLTVFQHVERSTKLLKQRVLAEVEEHLNDLVDRLLQKQREDLKAELRGRASRSEDAHDVLREAFANHLGEKATTAILNEVEQEARERLTVAWGEQLAKALDQLNQHLSAAAEEIDQRRLIQMTESLAGLALRHAEENSKSKVAVTTLAAAATAYSAWIGANAVAISIGGAIMSVGLPIVGLGVLAVWTKHALEKSSARDKAEQEADRLVDDYRARLKRDVLDAKFFPALRADIEVSGAEIGRSLLDEIAGGASHATVLEASRFYDAVANGRFDIAARMSGPEHALVTV